MNLFMLGAPVYGHLMIKMGSVGFSRVLCFREGCTPSSKLQQRPASSGFLLSIVFVRLLVLPQIPVLHEVCLQSTQWLT